MKIWGILFILLGGGAILAAVFNWHWWFRISSAGGHIVHDAFGRGFARLLNVVAGLGLLALGLADVTGRLPVSVFANAWLFEDKSYIKEASAPAEATRPRPPPDQSGLENYSP